jgi:O-antigen/teichoic acid export membrane protein
MIYTLAGALPMASGIILLPFYSDLPVEIFGAMSVYFSFSLLVQILVTYSFDASLYVNYHEFKNQPDKLSAFISSAFILILLISLSTGFLLAIIGNWVFSTFFTEQAILFYPFGILSVAIGIFQSLQKVNNSLLQTQQKPVLFFWFNLLSFGLIAGCTIVGLQLFPESLWGPIAGKLVATLVSAAWVLGFIFRQFGIHFNWRLLKTTFSYNNSTLIYQVQQWVINFFDRPFILLFLPLATLGVYDLGLKCLMALEFVLAGLNATFTPKVLAIAMGQKEKGSTVEINRYYHGLTAVAILLVSASIFVFPFLIEFLFTKPGYQQAVPLLPFLAIIYLFRCMRLYVAIPYSAVKYTKPLPFFYMIVLIFKIGLMYLLIGRYGIYGVIASTWLSYIVEIIILYLGIKNKFAFKINFAKMVIAPLSVSIMILTLEPFFGQAYQNVLHGFYVMVATGVLIWAFRNEIKVFRFSKLLN